jgi:uncharacterized membrane protein YfcA
MIIAVIVFIAVFVQTTAGFGLALVSMPLLVSLLDIRTATPLVSLIAVTAEVFLLIRFRAALNFRAVARLSLASLIGIPLGIYLLREVNTALITAALGIVIIGYALYALFTPQMPQIGNPNWAFGFGFLGGILSGAYNTSGPPVVIFGTMNGWSPAEFKSNLQGFFVLNSIMVLTTHTIAGNFTGLVWQSYLWGLPGIMAGLLLGFALDKRIDAAQFRRIVLVLLIFLGLRLIF